MKVSTIVIATAFALSSLAFAPAQAKHRHHHNHHEMHGKTTGMGSGPSGPKMDAGGVDKSRTGGQGVSRKPAE
ncbi:MAG: hypothetical protein WBV83_19600 [Bradyrhizobium sp.]|jgi:Spy/CpxP family protein refolding chaperone|uniref:hypothetical protein n=1 Tax=Bradyrhizobium sp. TaxID=376 RepID=UPI003C356D27